MSTLYEQYRKLNIDGSLICLEQVDNVYEYFCYPTNAVPIGFEACGSANPVEQIVWMSKEKFEEHLQSEREIQTEKQKKVLERLSKELHLTGMENPYEYVKAVQKDFDMSKVEYSDEYYDVLGIER